MESSWNKVLLLSALLTIEQSKAVPQSSFMVTVTASTFNAVEAECFLIHKPLIFARKQDKMV